MAAGDRRRKDKSKKKGFVQPKVLVTQDEWYTEAVKLEDAAERWFLSDVKKTMKGYLEAMPAYERALYGQDPNDDDTYNIHYNQTRLLLKIYTDYVKNDGHINLLQYVNLDGLGSLDTLIVSIETIIGRFETVVSRFPEQVGWDLLFNLLISYSTYVESESNLTGDVLIDIVTRFISHFQHIMRLEIELLTSDALAGTDEYEEESEEELAKYQRDDLAEQTKNLNTGSGVQTRQDDDSGELALSSETFDKETVVDTLALGYKFVYEIMANQLESDNNSNVEALINPAQKNYLEELLLKFLSQLNDMVLSAEINEEDAEEIILSKRCIESVKHLFSKDLPAFLDSLLLATEEEDVLMSNVDLIEMALDVFPEDVHWQLRTLMSKSLNKIQTSLATKQSDIISGKIKNKENELSPAVFKLCDVMINRADNELYRCHLKEAEFQQLQGQPHPTEDIQKTIRILQQNASTLLSNAKAIAHRSCGFNEFVTDKIKRNYIYNQASLRLDMIQFPGTKPLTEDLADHPFYTALCVQ